MKALIRIVVSAALLGLLAVKTDWRLLAESFGRLRLELWFAAVALFLGCQVLSAFRWQLLSRPLGFLNSFSSFLTYYFVGMYFNLMLPTSVGGDVVRAWYLDGGSGRRGAALVSVLIDRVSGLILLLMLACLATAFCPIPLEPWIRWTVFGAVGAIVVGGCGVMILSRWSDRFEGVRRLTDQVRLYLGMPGLVFGTSLLSLGVQAGNVVIVWLIGLALGLAVPAWYYWIIVPMVTLLTLLPVSLNGMGVREGGMILFLTPLGIESSAAISLTLLWFAVSAVAGLVGGVVYVCCRTKPGATPEEEDTDEAVRGSADQGRARQCPTAA